MQIQPDNETKSPVRRKYFRDDDRRRTLRIKRSGLQRSNLRDLDRPSIKFAESREELEQAFALVYQTYRQKGFITTPTSHEMLYSLYSILPSTVHVIAKSYLTVISNLSIIFDTPEFGLPMDDIYKKEMDGLRSQGRWIVELSALATPREHRWKNIFHFLVQAMYWYTRYRGVNDICIAVNPRHVRYYKALFPFKEFGEEKHYPRVGAPAVALRVKMENTKTLMRSICEQLDFETSLDAYFQFITGQACGKDEINGKRRGIAGQALMNAEGVRYFIEANPDIMSGLSPEQREVLNDCYPGLNL